MDVNKLQYVIRSEQNGREQNEDSYHVMTISPRLHGDLIYFLAVADGMGGHSYGEIVSKEALRKISLSLVDQLCVEPVINRPEEEVIQTDTLKRALYDAFQQANAHIRRMIEANQWGKAGSTVVVALLYGRTVVVGNLGDSPLFHWRAHTKQLIKRTEDHTVAGVLLRGGLITAEMARFHEGKNRLEFFAGADHLPKEPPIWDFEIAENDLLLLCSDGISGAITEEQIAGILSDPALNLEAQAEALIKAAVEAGETDNQTLILWRQGPFENTIKPVKQQIGLQELADSVKVEGGVAAAIKSNRPASTSATVTPSRPKEE